MGRKDSARGPFAERCFLVGPFRSAARADAPLYREALSSSSVRMDIGLSALQLRFLVTPCLAGACVTVLATVLAAGWRVLVKPSNILTVAMAECRKICRDFGINLSSISLFVSASHLA